MAVAAVRTTTSAPNQPLATLKANEAEFAGAVTTAREKKTVESGPVVTPPAEKANPPLESRAVVTPQNTDPPAEQANPPAPDKQEYENNLNALAAGLVGGTNTDTRSVVPLTDPKLSEYYQNLINMKLQYQASEGETLSLDKALRDVNDEMFDRVGHAAKNSDGDAGDIVGVIKGYWNNHDGKEHAAANAVAAYLKQRGEHPALTNNTNYEDNLNALASEFVGATLTESRTLATAFGDEKFDAFYKNLIKEKLKQQSEPLNLAQAREEVNKDLLDRIGNAAKNTGADAGDIVDVVKGYWDHHAGKESADALADKAYHEFHEANPPTEEGTSQIDPNANFDDQLNAVVSNMVGDPDKIKPFTDAAVRDHFANMIYSKLKEQQANGKPVDVDTAFDDVKEAIYGRLPHALRDDPKASDRLDELDTYWDDKNGKSDGGKVSTEAYSQFLKDTVLTNNTNYEDNLNALALGIGGGVIDDTRTLSAISDPTLGALYKNMITSDLKAGKSLDDAITHAHDDLFKRLPHALRDFPDGSGNIDIVKNYWDKHGGEKDAKRLGEEAYSAYVSEAGNSNPTKDKTLLAPSATDIMSAETANGKTVQELYVEKLRKAYENEPDDSDKKKFLRLIDAKAMLGGGYQYLPYAHDDIRNLTYYSDNPDAISKLEAEGLLNVEELDKKFAELAAKEDIAADSDKFLREAVGEIKDKKGLEDRIAATMLSPTYEKDILGLGDKAMERYASDIRSLQLLNPDRALEIQQKLGYTGAFKQLNDLFADPSKIGVDNIQAAARDIGDTLARASVLGTFAADSASRLFSAWDDWRTGAVKNLDQIRLPDGSELTKDEKDKLKLAKSTSDTLTEIFNKRMLAGQAAGGPNWWTNVTADVLDNEARTAMREAGVPDAHRTDINKFLKTMNTNGSMTTAGGVACLVAGVLALTKDGGKDLTTEERLGAAFYLLYTGSGITEATSQVTGGLQALLKKPGMKEAIGLDKNFKTVWEPGAPVTEENSRLWKGINKVVETKVGAKVAELYNKLPENARTFLNSAVDRLSKTLGPAVNALSATDKLKLIGPGLKALGALAYGAGGIIGIYLGADGLAKGGTSLEKGLAGMGLAAGVVWTGAAGIGLAAAFGIGGGVAASVGVGLGAIGTVLSIIGLGITSAIKYAKQQKAAGEVREYFNKLSKDGVLQSDWTTKLNYLIHVQYLYHSKKINPEWSKLYYPEDMAPWDAQRDHYNAFTEANKNKKASIDWWFPFGDNQSEELLKPHGALPDDLDFVKPGITSWVEHGSEGRGPK